MAVGGDTEPGAAVGNLGGGDAAGLRGERGDARGEKLRIGQAKSVAGAEKGVNSSQAERDELISCGTGRGAGRVCRKGTHQLVLEPYEADALAILSEFSHRRGLRWARISR